MSPTLALSKKGNCKFNFLQNVYLIKEMRWNELRNFLHKDISHQKPQLNQHDRRYNQVKSLLKKSLIGKAFNVLSRPETVAKPLDESVTDLKLLHPDVSEALPEVQIPFCPFKFNLPTTKKALLSYPAGGAPGLFGWSETLIPEDISDELLQIINFIFNQMSSGSLNGALKNLLTGSSLIGIPKQNGKTRPIAMGDFFYKIVSRWLTKQSNCSFLHQQHQFGVAFPNGTENLIHILRKKWYEKKHDGLISLDIKNAFNCVSRKAIFQALCARPELNFWFLFSCGHMKKSLCCQFPDTINLSSHPQV
ncbi:hypothetical protein P9112_000223 [Eukaryota sp. TZLM1-RC]